MTIPQRVVKRLAQQFPDAVFYKPTTKHQVALTVDDVPTPNAATPCPTRQILTAIAQHNQSLASTEAPVRGTFFVISSHLNGDTALLADIVAQGHEIANHGLMDDWAFRQSARCFADQFQQTHTRIATQVPAQRLRWYRPGRGLYRTAMLTPLRELNYEPRFALASMVPLDTLGAMANPAFTIGYVQAHIFPGAILLLHGGSALRARNTAIALPPILRSLRDRGYEVVTLSQLWDGA